MRGVYLRVGLLAVLVLGLVMGAVLFFGSARIRHGQGYETYFRDSVQGLEVGAAVKYRGVTVGQVASIGLVNAAYGDGLPRLDGDPAFRQVLVRIEVDTGRIGALPDTASLVRDGLRARIAPQGLTGQSYLELDFMDAARFPAPDVPWTPREPYIPSVQSTLSQVTDSATALLAKLAKIDVNGLASGMQGLITDLHGVLHGGQLGDVMSEAVVTLRLLNAGLKAADIPTMAADLRQTLAAARGLAEGKQTKDLLRAATQAADRLTQATARLPALLATLQDVAHRADTGSADVEAGLTPLLRDARAAVAALRQTAEAVRQDPAQAVLQAPPPRGLPR
jgi:ABC-type transporter Mla subunit MlaD